MKKIIFVLVSLFFFAQHIFANEQDILKKHFVSTIDKVVLIVKDKSLDKNTRNSHIVDTLTPMFDFEVMAKLSLGKVWKTLSKDDRENFIKLYVQRMKKSYSSKIDSYSDEKIEITKILQSKSNKIELVTNLVNENDKLEISYKFYKPHRIKENKDTWLIYDVVILGVSILRTDRAQFMDFLQTKSISDLMLELSKN